MPEDGEGWRGLLLGAGRGAEVPWRPPVAISMVLSPHPATSDYFATLETEAPALAPALPGFLLKDWGPGLK